MIMYYGDNINAVNNYFQTCLETCMLYARTENGRAHLKTRRALTTKTNARAPENEQARLKTEGAPDHWVRAPD